MKLLFDARSLQSSIKSGVPRVTEFLIDECVRKANGETITLVTTGWKPYTLPAREGVRHIHIKFPSKLLHLLLFLFRRPRLDLLVSRVTGEHYDSVFVPNFHFFASRAPYSLVVHDLGFMIDPGFLTPYERFVHAVKRPLALMKKAREIFAVSRSTKRDISSIAGRDAELIDIRNASLDPRVKPEDDKERRNILMLGTSEPRKNFENAIEGFLVSNLSANEKLFIMGTITNEGKKLRVKFSKHENIVWLGPKDDAEKIKLLSGVRALLYPSLYEGFGIPLIEAEQLGTPVITSHATSMPEISPGALLIDPHRPETITLALNLIT